MMMWVCILYPGVFGDLLDQSGLFSKPNPGRFLGGLPYLSYTAAQPCVEPSGAMVLQCWITVSTAVTVSLIVSDPF